MKRKFFKPLICKKRSKKRKIIIYEYENNISNLMRKLKIEDNDNESSSSVETVPFNFHPFESSLRNKLLSCNLKSHDNESSSSDETMPLNIRAFETSMRNKLLRCNLKTYSSYSSSENINVYKKAESKCIRLISVSTYLQGKVLSTPNSPKSPFRRYSRCYGTKNKTTVTAPKPLLNIANYLRQFDSRLTHGKFGSVLNLNLKCAEVRKNVNSVPVYGEEFILSVRQMQSFSLRKFKDLLPEDCLNRKIILHCEEFLSNSCPQSESVPCSNIKRSFDFWGGACKAVGTDGRSIGNIHVGDEKYARGTLKANMDTIKQTIIELMQLDLEIEKYVSVLRMFNCVSPPIPSIHEICKLKMKFADLVKESKYLQAKKSKLNREKCRESVFLNKEGKIDPIYDSYGEEGASNHLEKSVNIPYFAQQSCKRIKMDNEENSVILEGSKILDECLSGANFAENFYVNHENAIRPEDTEENNAHQAYEDEHHHYEAKISNAISDSGSLAESTTTGGFSSESVSDAEKRQTAFRLPSFHEAFRDIQKINGKFPGNLSSTILYDTDGGKKLVIFPYTNIYC